MAGKYDAYTLDVEGKFLVRPAVAPVVGGSGKHFAIRNLTAYPADLRLDPAVNVSTKTADPNGGDARFTINARADRDYPYQV